MASLIRKHSVVIAGHRTSVSLEPEFWDALKEMAAAHGVSLNELIARIDEKHAGNLSSALRLAVLDYFRARAEPGGSPR
jgi:predicted DNA-binding ribbon-helix-helix protein